MTTTETNDRSFSMRIEGRRVGAWLALPMVLTLAACGANAEAGAVAEDGEAEAGFQRIINVEVEETRPEAFDEQIRVTGRVEANRDVMVAAEESGVIRSVTVEKGQRVGAGRAIAKIDDAILLAQVEQARAQAALATETWERRKRLYEDDQVGSELAYLESKYAAEQATAGLRALEARLERTTIRAPIRGVLDDRSIELGSMVAPGQAVARIVQLDPLKVSAGVPERYALDVKRGDPVTVTFDALGDETFSGSISYVGSAVDPRNRTFPVEFTMANPGERIKPEMVASVSIQSGVLQDALVVPQEALVRVEDGYVAFVAVEEGGEWVARRRIVTLGPSQRNRVAIASGIEAGDRLIVVGQTQVADGDRIRLVEGVER